MINGRERVVERYRPWRGTSSYLEAVNTEPWFAVIFAFVLLLVVPFVARLAFPTTPTFERSFFTAVLLAAWWALSAAATARSHAAFDVVNRLELARLALVVEQSTAERAGVPAPVHECDVVCPVLGGSYVVEYTCANLLADDLQWFCPSCKAVHSDADWYSSVEFDLCESGCRNEECRFSERGDDVFGVTPASAVSE